MFTACFSSIISRSFTGTLRRVQSRCTPAAHRPFIVHAVTSLRIFANLFSAQDFSLWSVFERIRIEIPKKFRRIKTRIGPVTTDLAAFKRLREQAKCPLHGCGLFSGFSVRFAKPKVSLSSSWGRDFRPFRCNFVVGVGFEWRVRTLGLGAVSYIHLARPAFTGHTSDGHRTNAVAY